MKHHRNDNIVTWRQQPRSQLMWLPKAVPISKIRFSYSRSYVIFFVKKWWLWKEPVVADVGKLSDLKQGTAAQLPLRWRRTCPAVDAALSTYVRPDTMAACPWRPRSVVWTTLCMPTSGPRCYWYVHPWRGPHSVRNDSQSGEHSPDFVGCCMPPIDRSRLSFLGGCCFWWLVPGGQRRADRQFTWRNRRCLSQRHQTPTW